MSYGLQQYCEYDEVALPQLPLYNFIVPGNASGPFESDAFYHLRAAEQKRARSHTLYQVAQSYDMHQVPGT